MILLPLLCLGLAASILSGLCELQFGNNLICPGNVSIDQENKGQLIVPELETNHDSYRIWITNVTMYSTEAGLEYQLYALQNTLVKRFTASMTSHSGMHTEVLPIPFLLTGLEVMGVYFPGEVPLGYCDEEEKDYTTKIYRLDQTPDLPAPVSTYKQMRGRQYMISMAYERSTWSCYKTWSLDTKCDTGTANDTDPTPRLMTTEDLVYGICPGIGPDTTWITNITFCSISPGLEFYVAVIKPNHVRFVSEKIQTTQTGLVTHHLAIGFSSLATYEFLGFYFPGPIAFGYCTNGTDIQSVGRHPLRKGSMLPYIQHLEVIHNRKYLMRIGIVRSKCMPLEVKPDLEYTVVADFSSGCFDITHNGHWLQIATTGAFAVTKGGKRTYIRPKESLAHIWVRSKRLTLTQYGYQSRLSSYEENVLATSSESSDCIQLSASSETVIRLDEVWKWMPLLPETSTDWNLALEFTNSETNATGYNS